MKGDSASARPQAHPPAVTAGPRAGRPGLGEKRKRLARTSQRRVGRGRLSPAFQSQVRSALFGAQTGPQRPPSGLSPGLSGPVPRTPRPCAPANVLSRHPPALRSGAKAARGSRGARAGYAPSAWARGSARYSGSSWCRFSSRPWARWACIWRNGRWPGHDPRPGGGRSRTNYGAGSQTRSCPGYLLWIAGEASGKRPG